MFEDESISPISCRETRTWTPQETGGGAREKGFEPVAGITARTAVLILAQFGGSDWQLRCHSQTLLHRGGSDRLSTMEFKLGGWVVGSLTLMLRIREVIGAGANCRTVFVVSGQASALEDDR